MDYDKFEASNFLKLQHLLFAEDIEQVAFSSCGRTQIAAIVLSNSDIVLWKDKDNDLQGIKWLPWKNDSESRVQAIAFNPTSIQTLSENKIDLLIICNTVNVSLRFEKYNSSIFSAYDGSMYVIGTSQIFGRDPPHHHSRKYSLYPSCPISDFIPTAIVWWDSTHHRHKDIAVIGGNNGQIAFYSLTHSCYLNVLTTGSKSPIFSLSICCDFLQDYSYLLITNDLRQQWKLLLEKEVNGDSVVLLAFDENETPNNKIEKSVKIPTSSQQKSRLQEFKQMSVETFAILKQKLNDSRRPQIERPRIGNMNIEYSELQSCDCYGEAFLSVQQYKNRRVLTGLFIPESVLLLYLQNKDSTILLHHKFKISSLVTTILLTNTFVYVADIMETQHRILIFSTRLSETKKTEPIEYNPLCFIQSFLFPEEERIINLFKMERRIINTGFSSSSRSTETDYSSPQRNRCLDEEWNEACLVATNKGLYVICIKDNPTVLAMEAVKADLNIIKKLTLVFNLSFPIVIERLAEKIIEKHQINEAFALCKTTRCYSFKIAMKLASLGYTDDFINYAELLLSIPESDLNLLELIYISNNLLQSYVEVYLRDSSNSEVYKKIMDFLKKNNYYDEELNIHILAAYRLWPFVHFMAVWRGVSFDSTVSLTYMIAQNQLDNSKNLHQYDGFWELFSESALIQHFAMSSRSTHLHIQFFRKHLSEIPSHILERLYQFYDPTQLAVRPAMIRMLKIGPKRYLRLYDYKTNKWECDPNMYDWVTNFLFLHIHMYKYQHFDYALNKYVSNVLHAAMPMQFPYEPIEKSKSFGVPVLSAGNAHAAMIRNGSLLTWGQSNYGCLGHGPSLSQNLSLTSNVLFDHFKIMVKQVTCGRHHTLAMTSNGLYSWGSNKFGQLGVGPMGRSLYPRLVESFAPSEVAYIDAGQYHSLAVDISGKLWTWGWGVYGQLGHGNTDDQFFPKMVEKLKKKIIIEAYGGQAHSIVLTDKGKVFTFGCNTYGQLGIGTTIKSTLPVKVFGIQEKITLIATNYFHNLVVSESNRLYTWGCSPQILKLHAQSLKRARTLQNAYDKCEHPEGMNNNSDSSTCAEGGTHDQSFMTDHGKHLSPTVIDTSLVQDRIVQISCGLFHSALLSSSNQIYTWGRNVDGQLGNCKRQYEIPYPTPVNLFSLTLLPENKQPLDLRNRPTWRISCGKDFTLAMELDNRLFGWGNNMCGQLGVLPQEESNSTKYMNGKYIINKYSKRLNKVCHNTTNIVEKPIEIRGLPTAQLMYNEDLKTINPSAQMLCYLTQPGFCEENYAIIDSKTLYSELKASKDQVLHYYLECFHRFYNVEFVMNACAENNNYQAMSKICGLNYRFFEAFYYGAKSLFTYVRENYFFKSFKDSYGETKTRIIPKNITKKEDDEGKQPDGPRKVAVFEFMEDVIMEAVYIFEEYYKMTLRFTPEKIGAYLKKSLSVWIVWELPVQPLEWFYSKNWDQVAYPLAVFLFCDHYKSLNPSNDQEPKNSSQIENNWDEDSLPSSHLMAQTRPSSTTASKFSFINFSTASEYENLYEIKTDKHLQSNDPKYNLSSGELLQNLSVQFALKLCNVIIDSMSEKPNSEYEEFIRLLHEVVFAPSMLKSDNRNPNDVLSSILNTLQKSQPWKKKFIQVSYDELREQPIADRFIVFSCGHYFISQSDFEKEVKMVVRELDNLRLVSTSELVNRLYRNTCYTTCCPNCLFRYVECKNSAENLENSENSELV